MTKTASVLLAMVVAGMAACGSTTPSGGPDGGTGGKKAGTGGFVGTGGTNATGGATADAATGGTTATGGVGSGGTMDTGGATATGGTTATGGAGTGGAATGGAATGGMATTGGTGTAGSSVGGAGGGGGTAGTGGSAGFAGGAGIGGSGGSGGGAPCPADGATLNTGCASQALNTTIASAADAAVLSCQAVATCKLWRILTNCADQSLTAGTDTVTQLPACVCKPAGSAPGAAHALYVDPNPPGASFMTNGPTGTIQPPSCRLRRLRDALAVTNTTFTQVVAFSEVGPKHYLNEFKDPLTNGYSAAPLIVPEGVELTTISATSFGSSLVNIYLFGGDAPRIVLSRGSSLSGFGLQGAPSETAPEGITYGAEILGCSSGSASVQNIAILGTGTGTMQTAIHVSGTCALTADRLYIGNVPRGVVVDPSATFTGTNVTVMP